MSNNPIEKSLDNLAEISKKIMLKCVDTGELSKTDILFLSMYQKEKNRAVAIPTHKKIINAIKDIISTVKDVLPASTSEQDVIDNNNTDVILEKVENMEVDTDEL